MDNDDSALTETGIIAFQEQLCRWIMDHVLNPEGEYRFI
jgi:hypothetical protein